MVRMYFDNDDMVTIRKKGHKPQNIKKQDISDFLIKRQLKIDEIAKSALRISGRPCPQDGMEIIEKAIILSNLSNIVSIKLTEEDEIVQFYPIGMKLKISKVIWEFLISVLNS